MKTNSIIKNIEIIGVSSDFVGYGIYNGKKCFVDNTVVGDVVDIQIYKETNKYYIAKIDKIIKQSQNRTNPQCKYFGVCGGCSLQHINEEYYYNLKRDFTVNAFKQNNININNIPIDIIKVGKGKRRRVALQYKNGECGFFQNNTNEIVRIDNCINIKPEINEIINFLNGKKFTNLKCIDILSISNDIAINLIFDGDVKIKELQQFNELKDKVLYINYTDKDKKFYIPVFKNGDLQLKLDDINIQLPNDCFLQATDESQNKMIEIVKNGLLKCKKVVDLYCGIGTYSFPLSKQSRVFAFEGDKNMVEILKRNNNLNRLNIVATQRDLFNQPLIIRELNEFDGCAINPPRNGAENQCKFLAKSNIKKIVYVSCNPMTLTRDLQLFKDNFNIKHIFIIDQFYWSKHLENIVILEHK